MKKLDKIIINSILNKKSLQGLKEQEEKVEFFSYLKYNRIYDTYRYRFMSSKERIKQKKHVKEEEFLKIIEELNKNKIDYVHIKGINYYSLYKSDIRQSKDFDIIVKSANDFIATNKILEKFEFETKIGTATLGEDENLQGIFEYKKNLKNEISLSIEVSIGGLIIADYTWYYNFWEYKKILTYNNVSINVPSDKVNLMILIIEASGRHTFMTRDLIDFILLTKELRYSRKHIKEYLKDEYLFSVYCNLEDIKKEYYNGNELDKENKNFKCRFYKHILPLILSDWSWRKTILVLFNILARKLIKKRVIWLWGTLNRFERVISPKTHFRNGILVGMFQIDNERGDFNISKKKKNYMWKTPIGTFLSSNYGILNEEQETLFDNFQD